MSKKFIAIAKVVEKADVTALLLNSNETPHDAAIFIEIPELGMTDLIYCRYGLSIPYYKVQVGEKLLVEPTIGESERWFYVGLADVGGAASSAEAEPIVLGAELRTFITDLVGEINDEPIQKLNDLISEYNSHTHGGVIVSVSGGSGAPATGVTGDSAAISPGSSIDVADTTDATDDILSDVNFSKKQ